MKILSKFLIITGLSLLYFSVNYLSVKKAINDAFKANKVSITIIKKAI